MIIFLEPTLNEHTSINNVMIRGGKVYLNPLIACNMIVFGMSSLGYGNLGQGSHGCRLGVATSAKKIVTNNPSILFLYIHIKEQFYIT